MMDSVKVAHELLHMLTGLLLALWLRQPFQHLVSTPKVPTKLTCIFNHITLGRNSFCSGPFWGQKG
jgi:hypothetical protein